MDSSAKNEDASQTPDPNRSTPHPNCYWVPNSSVLAGEYPAHRDDASSRARLRAILDAGVRVFIDLTESNEGLRAYDVMLLEEAAALGVAVRHHRFAIPDMSIPASNGTMHDILDVLDAAAAANEIAYVHCWGGVGRTGTVVGCLLVRRGHSGIEALAQVKQLFAGMSAAKLARHPDGSPETEPQRAYVRSWEASGP